MRNVAIDGCCRVNVSEIVCGTSNLAYKVPLEGSLKLPDIYYEGGGMEFDAARVCGEV